MQHTKTPTLAKLRTRRSVIITRLVRDRQIQDELSTYRNDLNQQDLDAVNAQIVKAKLRA